MRVVRRYSPEVTQEAIQLLKSGVPVRDVARKLNIPYGTVSTWATKELAGPVVPLFKVPGLSDFSMNGLLSVLQSRRDELIEMASVYDAAIQALVKLETVESSMAKLQTERDEHKKALKFFLEEKPQ